MATAQSSSLTPQPILFISTLLKFLLLPLLSSLSVMQGRVTQRGATCKFLSHTGSAAAPLQLGLATGLGAGFVSSSHPLAGRQGCGTPSFWSFKAEAKPRQVFTFRRRRALRDWRGLLQTQPRALQSTQEPGARAALCSLPQASPGTEACLSFSRAGVGCPTSFLGWYPRSSTPGSLTQSTGSLQHLP